MPGHRKIKVLQAIRQGLIGGGESHVLSLVAALDKDRFEPLVLSFTDGPMVDRLKEMDIPCYVIPSLKAFDLRSWSEVRALIRDEKVDIIHAHGSRAASNLFLPAKLSRCPMVYTIHGWSFHEDQPFLKKRLRIWSEQLLTTVSDANISVSASNQNTGISHFSGFRSTIINNGIDLEVFNPGRELPDVRAELGIPSDHTVIGYIARITLQKDPLNLVRAFKKVLERQQNVTLLAVGDGDLKSEMVELARELGIDRNIIFLPFRTDVPALLKAMDIYCLPSLWEGMPIGLLEAMAMAKAVIVTKVDGSKEIVQDRENGLVVQARDPHELAAAMLTLHENIPFRRKLQQQAAATVTRSYCMSGMARQVESLYGEIFFNQQQRIRINEPYNV